MGRHRGPPGTTRWPAAPWPPTGRNGWSASSARSWRPGSTSGSPRCAGTGSFDDITEAMLAGELDPYEAADRVLALLVAGRRRPSRPLRTPSKSTHRHGSARVACGRDRRGRPDDHVPARCRWPPIGELHRAVRSHHDPLPPAEEDPLWFQRAVFYEVLIRGFFDGNNDGVGDIPGLIAKLDYLQWLGVDCLWLLPFYPSPLRDGGYDISDYYSVHPESGTVDDLRRLLDEAHARGIRVIADLVINHTSDQNPWFIESRSSRDNPKADWYVWNDDDQRWPEARVVFIDVERSNWAYDPVRNQYYWHRFYSHQPDLNYENPEVAEAMLNVVRYWLDLGLDGFRLDAVPFLFQKDGTAGENLPETHAFIRRVRAELDTNYPGRILLAEANGWPADVADYFGDDDECHLCFNFPLMPRLFMAVRREQSFPITEILAQTPEPPGSCPVGHLPAQPRRADPGDGHRGGAGLPLLRVRQGPPDEAAHGHRPPPGPPARPGPPPVRAALLPPVHPAGEPGPLLRGRDPDGRQPLPRRPRLGAHAHAVDARTGTAGSAGPTSPSCTCLP